MTELTTTPEVPAWLNLDVVAPPELRVELNMLAVELEALHPVVEEIARRCYTATRGYAAACEASGLYDAVAEPTESVDLHTGSSRLWSAGRWIADLANIAIGEEPETSAPEWYEREKIVAEGLGA